MSHANPVADQPRSSAWYLNPWCWLLVAVPGSAVLMAAVMLPLALSSDDGLVVDDYYRQGLEINRRQTRDLKAQELQLSASVAFDNQSHKATVSLTTPQSFEYPQTIRLQAFHSTLSGFDQDLTMLHTDGGTYLGQPLSLRPGRWNWQLEAPDWRVTGSIMVSTPETSAN